MKTKDREKKAKSEGDRRNRTQAASVTPGAAEGDLETIEQDLEEKERSGPVE